MTQFIIRAAQIEFCKAGYSRMEAYRQAERVAAYMLANLRRCKARFGIDDELDLARHMARLALSHAGRDGLN